LIFSSNLFNEELNLSVHLVGEPFLGELSAFSFPSTFRSHFSIRYLHNLILRVYRYALAIVQPITVLKPLNPHPSVICNEDAFAMGLVFTPVFNIETLLAVVCTLIAMNGCF
jgi:hypothetical protein